MMLLRRRPTLALVAATRPGVRRRRLYSSISSATNAQLTPHQREIVERDAHGHVSVVGGFATGKSTTAAERVLWLHSHQNKPHGSTNRRVLALSGRSSDDAAMVRYVDHATSFHALERRGHRVAGIMEWTQHTLEELNHRSTDTGTSSGRSRVLSFGKMTAFLMHHAQELPLRVFHQRLATQSSMQLRRSVADMLRFFTMLEAHGVTPAAYTEYATVLRTSSSTVDAEDHEELAHAYQVYRDLQQRHDVSSWDGLVLDLQQLITRDPHCLRAATHEFTDIVVDDLHRMSPAMVQLVALVAQQPHIQSGTSFSHSAMSSALCPRTEQLHSLLQQPELVTIKLPSFGENAIAATKDREQIQTVAARVLSSTHHTSNPPPPPLSQDAERTAIPVIRSLVFDTSAEETTALAQWIKEKETKQSLARVTVFCPSVADAQYVSHALATNGVRVQGHHDASSSLATTRRTRHLFDEPGVDALFSLLVALWSPSDTKHVYNVLRSEFFAFPPQTLSHIMEKHHRQASHTTLVDVLTAFVAAAGQEDGKEDGSMAASLAAATRFLSILQQCRDQCHSKSVADLVQFFLEQTGHLEMLLDPQSRHEARKAIALAAFLREITAAQRIVESAFVPFVVPYLVQLQSARVATISDHDAFGFDDDGDAMEDTTGAGTSSTSSRVRVVPLTRYTLDELEAEDGQDKTRELLVFTAMRDAKFPGRLKRITWPLPTALLSKPLPVQTRDEFLTDAETLVYDALLQLNPSEIVLSYAKMGHGSTGKRQDKLSRVLEPLWALSQPQEEEEKTQPSSPPAEDGGGAKASSSSPAATSTDPLSSTNPPPLATTTTTSSSSSFQPTHLSFSQLSEYTRCPHKYYLSRVLGLRDLASTSDQAPQLAMMFGSAVHEAVAAFALALQKGDSVDVAHVHASHVLESCWNKDGFLSARQELFFVERARSTLRGFIERETAHQEANPSEIVFVEKQFECRLGHDSTDVLLKGVWDRVDRTRDGVVIREFKTNPSSQKRPKLDAVAAESLQLQIYMVAYEKLHGETPHGATLEVLGDHSSSSSGTSGTGFVAFAPSMRDRVAQEVDAAMENMRKGQFDATPGFLECGMCPYASSACRASVVETAEDGGVVGTTLQQSSSSTSTA